MSWRDNMWKKAVSLLLILSLIQPLLLILGSKTAAAQNQKVVCHTIFSGGYSENLAAGTISPGMEYGGNLAPGDNYCYKFYVKKGERVSLSVGPQLSFLYDAYYQSPSDESPVSVPYFVQKNAGTDGYWMLWISSSGYSGPYSFYLSIRPAIRNRIAILIPTSLYNTSSGSWNVSYSVNQYATDISSAVRCKVEIHTGTWSTSGDVRNYLRNLYESSGSLRGAILIGDIPPSGMFEIPSENTTEHFPTDFFYMDLDGIATDSDGDGYYDCHYGDVKPEIWTGRLKASNMAMYDEKTLLLEYLYRNHNYRTSSSIFPDSPTVPKRALVYVDDGALDPPAAAENISGEISNVYSDRTIVSDSNTTSASNYLQMLQNEYEWVHIEAHGMPTYQTFKVGAGWDYATSDNIALSNPKAVFYTLSSCNVGKYTEYNYLAGAYVFNWGWGLSAFTNTGIGGLTSFNEIYRSLGQNDGDLFGDALLQMDEKSIYLPYTWESDNLTSHSYDALKWIIIGDPTLRVRASPTHLICDDNISVNLGSGVYINVQLKDDDNYPIAGESIVGEIYRNGSWSRIENYISTDPQTHENGDVQFLLLAGLPSGSYPLRFSFGGDNQYLASSCTSSCTVGTLSTTLSVTPTSFTVNSGQTQTLTATLTSDGTPLASKTVTWSATSGSVSSSSGTTDSSGQVSATYTAPTVAASTSVTITASFAGDSQYMASSGTPTCTVQVSVTFTFTKPDGSPLANTTIYYGTSQGQEAEALGTTDSTGNITSTNSTLANKTLYFKSSDGKYTGNTYVSSTGGSTSVSLTEVSGFSILWVIIIVLVVVVITGTVVLVKKRRGRTPFRQLSS